MDARWLSETGLMVDSNYQQWELGSDLDQLDIWEGLNQTLSSESYSLNPPESCIASNTYSCGSSIDSSNACGGAAAGFQRGKKTPSILSFGNPEPGTLEECELYQSMVVISSANQENGMKSYRSMKRSYDAMTAEQREKKPGSSAAPPQRISSHNQEHILAERRRREKLSQRFIALSAIIPGLKKMDKATVLGDAIKHLKTLQEKVKALEEQAAKRTESVVHLKKSHLTAEDDNDASSSDQNFGLALSRLPEIEVKLSGKSLLIKIHCENRKGFLVRSLSEIEKLHITVVSANVLPFASSSLDITVTAQIEDGFSMTVKDLVRKLSSSFRAAPLCNA